MMQRQADPVTMDHIIELRKEIARLEKENMNYSNHAGKVYAALVDIRQILRHCDEPNQTVLNSITNALKGL